MFSRKIMVLLGLLLIGSVVLGVVGNNVAQAEEPRPNWPTCVTSGLNDGVIGDVTVGGKSYFVRRMALILDPGMHDSGTSAADDNLEIFCVSKNGDDRFGNIAMCLSGEKCPWRR